MFDSSVNDSLVYTGSDYEQIILVITTAYKIHIHRIDLVSLKTVIKNILHSIHQQSLAAKLNKNIDFNILSKTMKTVFGSQLPTIPLNWAWIYFQNWRFLSRINSLISLTTSSLIKLMANLALSFKYLDFFTTYPPFRVSTGRVDECRLRFVPRAHTVLFSK